MNKIGIGLLQKMLIFCTNQKQILLLYKYIYKSKRFFLHGKVATDHMTWLLLAGKVCSCSVPTEKAPNHGTLYIWRKTTGNYFVIINIGGTGETKQKYTSTGKKKKISLPFILFTIWYNLNKAPPKVTYFLNQPLFTPRFSQTMTITPSPCPHIAILR